MFDRSRRAASEAGRIGFVGTGNLTRFLVARLSEQRATTEPLVVSPRNPAVAKHLADQYGAVIAESNQDVVDQTEIVFLCLPTSIVEKAVGMLRFEPHHRVLSAIAGMPYGMLRELVAPGEAISIMLPGAPSRVGDGLTLVYPETRAVKTLLELFGPVHFCGTQEEYRRTAVFGGLSGCLFHLAHNLDAGLRHLDIDGRAARCLVAEAFRGVGSAYSSESGMPVDDLVAGVATKGGMTMEGLKHLLEHGNAEAWRGALVRMAAFQSTMGQESNR